MSIHCEGKPSSGMFKNNGMFVLPYKWSMKSLLETLQRQKRETLGSSSCISSILERRPGNLELSNQINSEEEFVGSVLTARS